jgi:hypothetical protein
MTQVQSPLLTRPPTLHEIEAQLQAAILNGDEAVLASLADGARASRVTLLGVYRHAYAARLLDVLAHDYPLLRRYIGDEAFERLARAFIAAHPSRSRNVRWFGAGFPEFLERQDSASKHAELSEVAAIEKAVSDSFDSVDAPLLRFADVAAHAPEAWPRLRFVFHPSLSLAPVTTNAFEIWKALNEMLAPPSAGAFTEVRIVVVWRQGVSPRVRLLANEEAMLCFEVKRGASFGTLCEMLAMRDPDGAPARAAGYLQSWLTDEMLTSAQYE